MIDEKKPSAGPLGRRVHTQETWEIVAALQLKVQSLEAKLAKRDQGIVQLTQQCANESTKLVNALDALAQARAEIERLKGQE